MRPSAILIAAKNVIKKFKYFFIGWCFTVLGISAIVYFSSLDNKPKLKYDRYKREDGHHKLCLIVPFRDRFEELLEFAPHITKFLDRQRVKHHITVVNQIDEFRFNRGSLINAGFKFVLANITDCDYIGMHDVDLLPLNDNISYAYPGDDAFHVASPNLHPRYHYQTFIGGILLINRKQFASVNGLSNRYWGWGMEDDELYLRLKEGKIKVLRPGKLSTDITNSFRHIHGPKRKRDMVRCFNQARVNMKRDRLTGLNNVNYGVTSVNSLVIDNCNVSLVNVELYCDRQVTPWCSCGVSSFPTFFR
ncbi:hypothetical protein V9T40_005310 [Parthenolecanium corni]|uniref:Beta-1,4-N-acetylgalactosaminyltransferase n=1 Tax=Parthenolecanium corni TaxID=536013 RepID=A0AAN9TDV4_9HEMI